MKKRTLQLLFCILLASYGYAQNKISLGGFYIAKTGSIAAAHADIYTYLRFYKDGSVYLQAVTSNDPQAVARWFGRFKTWSQKGTYTINGTNIVLKLSNAASKDAALEKNQKTAFSGLIKTDSELCLTRDKEANENCFVFAGVQDTTKLKYSAYKPEILLPGDWKVKQILKESRQVFFTNEDSVIVAFSVFKANELPVYKEGQSDFESAVGYYEWDSKYMHDQEKMDVKKLSENKDKAFVIWNAKDTYNDNYHLFARHNELLYNIMVFDTKMSISQRLAYLEMLYDLNKD